MKKEYEKVMHRVQADEALRSRTLTAWAEEKAPSRNRTWFGVDLARPVMKQAVALLTMVVLLAGLSLGGYAWYMTPVSYLDLDINPMVEAALNGLDHVVSVKGYNTDGEKLVKEVNWKGKPLDEIVQALVTEAEQQGYLPEGQENAIALTTVTDKPEKAEKLAEQARKGTESALEEADVDAEIFEEGVGSERVLRAREIGITPGKLNLIEKLQAAERTSYDEEDEEFSDLYETPVRDIMKRIQKSKRTGKDGEDFVPPGQERKEGEENAPRRQNKKGEKDNSSPGQAAKAKDDNENDEDAASEEMDLELSDNEESEESQQPEETEGEETVEEDPDGGSRGNDQSDQNGDGTGSANGGGNR